MGLLDIFRKSTEKAVKVTADQVEVKGKVIAKSLLNVRQKPSLRSKVVGQLRRNDIVKILNELDDWYEILWKNNTKAYVYKKYILIIAYIKKGIVTANILNVRKYPSLDAPVVGRLKKNKEVFIIEELNDWYGIEFYQRVAYVASKFIEAHDLPPIGGEQAVSKFFAKRKDLASYPLKPARQISSKSPYAEFWNNYGNLIERLSMELGIEKEVALATMMVESGGKGFDDKGRLIIRFETHIFKRELKNDEVYNKHFRDNNFRNQQFYDPDTKQWVNLHQKDGQDLEWKAFNIARKINEDAAYKAISMGAPQILGINYAIIGYDSAKEMFQYFSEDIRYHIFGFFDFIKSDVRLLSAIQKKDFASFAKIYNGSGQVSYYSKAIRTAYLEFKKIL